jgi:branched-chain amino acid transport system ATP-binding protein
MMLRIEGLAASYGAAAALADVSLGIAAGEVVTLLGRNGMGKTTTVRAVMGLLGSVGGRITAGRILFEGGGLMGRPSHAIARLGSDWCRRAGRSSRRSACARTCWRPPGRAAGTLAAVHDLFPRLAERGANAGRNLSGGEQQMLAIGRA